jgi:hypothetical protein
MMIPKQVQANPSTTFVPVVSKLASQDPRGNNRIISGRASCYLVMAGEGRPSTSLLPAQREDVDADLRRHDDVEATVASRGAIVSRRILSLVAADVNYMACQMPIISSKRRVTCKLTRFPVCRLL